MTKITTAIVLGLAALTAMPAAAKRPAESADRAARTTRTATSDTTHTRRQHRDLFRGIDLTPQQQTALAALRESNRPTAHDFARSHRRTVATADTTAAGGPRAGRLAYHRSQRATSDSVAGQSRRMRNTADRKHRRENLCKNGHRRGGRRLNSQYINQVKAILTPEQYVIFLENVAARQ